MGCRFLGGGLTCICYLTSGLQQISVCGSQSFFSRLPAGSKRSSEIENRDHMKLVLVCLHCLKRTSGTVFYLSLFIYFKAPHVKSDQIRPLRSSDQSLLVILVLSSKVTELVSVLILHRVIYFPSINTFKSRLKTHL